MTDFYQILKRETLPLDGEKTTDAKADNFDLSDMPVDNFRERNEKKIKPINRIAKRNITKRNPIAKNLKKTRRGKRRITETTLLSLAPANPIWLTLAEAAKLGGVQKRTIKRALRSGSIKYRIVERRYQVDLGSTLLYFFSRKKLWNKLMMAGIGQYVEKWRN